MRNFLVSLYMSENCVSVCVSSAANVRDMEACKESPNAISASEPSVICAPVANGSIPGSNDKRPGREGAAVTRHRALPTFPPASILGIIDSNVDEAKEENAIRPSRSNNDCESCPSKILAASSGDKLERLAKPPPSPPEPEADSVAEDKTRFFDHSDA